MEQRSFSISVEFVILQIIIVPKWITVTFSYIQNTQYNIKTNKSVMYGFI